MLLEGGERSVNKIRVTIRYVASQSVYLLKYDSGLKKKYRQRKQEAASVVSMASSRDSFFISVAYATPHLRVAALVAKEKNPEIR